MRVKSWMIDSTQTARFAQRGGLLALDLLALSAFLSTALGSLAMVLLALCFALAHSGRIAPLRVWRPATLAVCLLICSILARTLIASVQTPEYLGLLWGDASAWCKLWLFVPAAWFLDGDSGRARRLLTLALTGLILGMLWRLDWTLLLDDPLQFIHSRDQYGFTAIASALYTGAALLGLLLLGEARARAASSSISIAARILWWILVGLTALTLLQSQSRGSWAAWLPALGFGFWLRTRIEPRIRAADASRRWRWLAWIGIALGALAIWLLADDLIARIRQDLAWFSGETQETGASSLGQRWNAQVIGVQLWLERPWFGWGPGLSQTLMDLSGDPGVRDGWGVALRHLHNTYLEVLFQFGVIGLLLTGFLVALLWRALWRGWRDDQRLRIALASILLYLLLWSLTNYRVTHHDWLMFWILVAGAAQGSIVTQWRSSRNAMNRHQLTCDG